jgi:hypothetical protein
MLSLFAKLEQEKKMTEEKEAGGMNAGDASTNDSLSLSRRSTGPRTLEGKERSKHNAIKHGIFSKVVVLKDEPRAAFDALLNGFFDDLQPQGALEETLVEKLAVLTWRYRRLIVAEAESCKSIGLVDLGGACWTTDHLLRYEASIERAFDRALIQLERLQRMRLGQPISPPIKLDISSA